jgi:hypothetical protein
MERKSLKRIRIRRRDFLGADSATASAITGTWQGSKSKKKWPSDGRPTKRESGEPIEKMGYLYIT